MQSLLFADRTDPCKYSNDGYCDVPEFCSEGDHADCAVVRFALLIPISGPNKQGLWIAGAAALAVEKINTDSTLLHEKRLEYSWADTGCSPEQGRAALEKLQRKNRINAIRAGVQLSV